MLLEFLLGQILRQRSDDHSSKLVKHSRTRYDSLRAEAFDNLATVIFSFPGHVVERTWLGEHTLSQVWPQTSDRFAVQGALLSPHQNRRGEVRCFRLQRQCRT